MLMRVFLLLLTVAVSVFSQSTKTVCASGCDYIPAQLQQAFDEITTFGCGSTLRIAPGDYTPSGSNYTLPAPNCSFANPITVESSGPLPPAGVRMTPNYLDAPGGPLIPVLHKTAIGTVLKTSNSDTTDGLVVRGIGVDCSPGMSNATCVDVDNSSASVAADKPNEVRFERCIFRGTRLSPVRVGLDLSGGNLEFLDGWIGDLFDSGSTDGQAIRSLDGPGPITIRNAYLQGMTETVGIGGAPPSIYSPTPSPNNLLISGNIADNIVIDESHITHGLWYRFNGTSPFTWRSNTLVAKGQIWMRCSDAADGFFGSVGYSCNGGNNRVGVYQAQNMGVTGATIPTVCTTASCTFVDGAVTWKAISPFPSTYLSAGVAKNLSECKQCGRWSITRSFLQHAWEGGWGGGPQGYGLTFYHRSNEAPYSTIGPFTFEDNHIDDVGTVIQSGAYGDSTDFNIYPSVRSQNPEPYTITSGSNTLILDGTTITLTPGTWTAAQIAGQINAALPGYTLTSVNGPINDVWHYEYILTFSGSLPYTNVDNVGLSGTRNTGLGVSLSDVTRTDTSEDYSNRYLAMTCAGAGLNASGNDCDNQVGATQLKIQGPVGQTFTFGEGTRLAAPVNAMAVSGDDQGRMYLYIVKASRRSTLTLDGSALAALGLGSARTVYYCTHPATWRWYGCGNAQGMFFRNNLVTNFATDSNFTPSRIPYGVMLNGIGKVEISHNSFLDFGTANKYPANGGSLPSGDFGGLFLGVSQTPSSPGVISNNLARPNLNASGEYTNYFYDGAWRGMSFIHGYLCNAPLDSNHVPGYTYSTAWSGKPAPSCASAPAAGNVFPQATLYSADTINGLNFGTGGSSVPNNNYAPSSKSLVIYDAKDNTRLAKPGTITTLRGTFNVMGSASNTTTNAAGPYELGMAFSSSLDGNVIGFRVFRASNGCSNTGTITGRLWRASDGVKLAEKTVSNFPNGQWTGFLFDAPVAITKNTQYVISYSPSVACYSTNVGNFSSGIVNFPLKAPVSGSRFGSTPNVMPTTTTNNGFGADVQFQATEQFAVGQNGTVGAAELKSYGDHRPVGVDFSRLPLIRDLKVQYSDRAAIISWLDSQVSRNIPGVLRLCIDDPDYNPQCSPAGSLTTVDPASGALADNSDSDSSPKHGLTRYIVVTGLAANTKYYGQLYRGGDYRAFSFTTAAPMRGLANVALRRAATATMGAVANMFVTYGGAYSRRADSISGSAASAPCSNQSVCSTTITAGIGTPLYYRADMRGADGSVLYTYPVSVVIPGGRMLEP
jgi:hypothetical protein